MSMYILYGIYVIFSGHFLYQILYDLIVTCVAGPVCIGTMF